MSEDKLKRIMVIIAGRNYPVRIKPEEEKTVRMIEKDVNDKINEFQLSYQGKDTQDYMSLALLSYAFDLHKAKNSKDHQVLNDKLTHLESLLDETS